MPEVKGYTTKIVRKVLYFRSNQLPQKKIMTFKNITNDLILNASYSIGNILYLFISRYNKGDSVTYLIHAVFAEKAKK